MRTTINFLLFLSIFLSSCRFSKPIFLKEINTSTVNDSISNTTISRTNYNFFRPTLHGYKGRYSIVETKDSNGIVIKYHTTKTNYIVRDGQAKSWTELFFYKNGIKTQKQRIITKGQGKREGKILLNKSTLYNDSGEKINIINNLK